ncbi:MAG: hypothetical protein EP330_11885 [Deltaproteobacteria bacterium]|nr:MAG: hypothetical protein EP330_11885 [Deltaproteobacteria bacterium]
MSTPEIRTPPETRWTCGGCGACCRGYSFGPVSERIIKGLEEADIGAHWPLAASQPWYQIQDGPTGEAYYLAKVDDHCIFLRDDNLCAVHAALGAEAKPAFCREFPFHLVEDERGLTAVIRADCKSWHESFDSAEPVAADAAEVAAMTRVMPIRQFKGDTVPVLPGVAVPMGQWLELEDVLAAGLVRERQPEAHIAWIRTQLVRAGMPLPEEGNPERARMAQQALLQAMAMMMRRVLAEEGPNEQQAEAEERARAVELVLSRLGEPLPALDDRAVGFLGAALRSVWTGRLWTSGGDVAGGLGRWLFLVTCARIEAGGDTLTAAEFSKTYHLWRRFAVNRTIAWTLEKARPALVDLFLTA